MPGRNYNSPNYQYGFNGKENDNGVHLDASGFPLLGSQQDYGMRIYNAALGRFLSVDPLTPDYPELTPYQFANNTPIQAIDLDGLENYHYTLIREESKGKPIFIISYDRTELTEYDPFTSKDERLLTNPLS